MLTRALVNALAIGGLTLAGLVGIIARRTTVRRRAVAALAITLATLSVLFWASRALSSYQLLQPAPVSDALTIYFNGQDCNGFTSLACQRQPTLYALRARDGAARWRRALPGPIYPDSPGPVLRNGVLYATSANAQGSGIVVIAVRASDGAALWRIARPTYGVIHVIGDSLFLEMPPTASGDPMRGVTQVDVLRLSDGARVRSILLPPGDGPLTLEGGVAYRCQSDGALVALRLSDGHPMWRAVVRAAVTGATTSAQNDARCVVTVGDGVVYAQTGAPAYHSQLVDSSIVAARASDGHILWRYHTGPSAPLTVSGGAIFTVAYVASPPGKYGTPGPVESVVIALRARDGALLWQRALESAYRNAGLVTSGGGAIYVGMLGSLLALRGADGARLWRYQDAPNYLLSPLVALDNVVVVGSGFSGSGLAFENGFPQPYLLALRPGDGAPYWQTAFGAESPPALGLIQ